MRINSRAYRNMMNTLGKLMEEVIHCKEELNRMEKELTELRNRPTLNVDLLREDMEEDECIKCVNCISASVSPYEEPCISCMFNPFNNDDGIDKFYPNMEKLYSWDEDAYHNWDESICESCKHIELMGDKYPCCNCENGDRWEKQ